MEPSTNFIEIKYDTRAGDEKGLVITAPPSVLQEAAESGYMKTIAGEDIDEIVFQNENGIETKLPFIVWK